MNASKLISQFIEPEGSIGKFLKFRRKLLHRKNQSEVQKPASVEKAVKDSYKTLIMVGNKKENLSLIYSKFHRAGIGRGD